MPQFKDERLLIEEVRNHAEFRGKLTNLRLTSDFLVYDAAVEGVIKCWFVLAQEHANELIALAPSQTPRAVYSRSYYAAYNASKAVRYACFGIVSLKGDDHRKVSELPDSFPNVDAWARDLQVLYEHRLRADYDNWADTPNEHTLKPADCRDLALRFLEDCRSFLLGGYNLNV